MMGVVAAVLLWAALGLSEASTQLEVGVCPNVRTQPNLDLRQMEGRWYHIIRFPNDDEPFASCTQSTYNYTDGYLEVVTEGRDASGEAVSRSGVLGTLPDSPTGTLQLDMDGMPPLMLWVIYSDYDKLACLYSCAEFPGLRAEWAWAISRVPNPKVRVVVRCRAKLRNRYINSAKFQRVPRNATCPNT